MRTLRSRSIQTVRFLGVLKATRRQGEPWAFSSLEVEAGSLGGARQGRNFGHGPIQHFAHELSSAQDRQGLAEPLSPERIQFPVFIGHDLHGGQIAGGGSGFLRNEG